MVATGSNSTPGDCIQGFSQGSRFCKSSDNMNSDIANLPSNSENCVKEFAGVSSRISSRTVHAKKELCSGMASNSFDSGGLESPVNDTITSQYAIAEHDCPSGGFTYNHAIVCARACTDADQGRNHNCIHKSSNSVPQNRSIADSNSYEALGGGSPGPGPSKDDVRGPSLADVYGLASSSYSSPEPGPYPADVVSNILSPADSRHTPAEKAARAEHVAGLSCPTPVRPSHNKGLLGSGRQIGRAHVRTPVTA